MRTKGAKNRTPEEREQLLEDRKARAAARGKLPSNRQKLVLDVIAQNPKGVSISGISDELHANGHLLKSGHVKSLVGQLAKKGLVSATVRHTVYTVLTA